MEFDRAALSLPYHDSPSAVPGDEPGEADMMQAMMERILRLDPKSGAEALQHLRAAFPDAPLALRVAVLGMLMHRSGRRPRAA